MSCTPSRILDRLASVMDGSICVRECVCVCVCVCVYVYVEIDMCTEVVNVSISVIN